ncbi:MAG: hypothetical protein CMJ64_14410 [Planctomycetaceae bacterium]|nr:hypothetical protein [Planctomycetaceae bacterium]
MSGQSFRFIHAGSFHLEGTLAGISDAPEHMLELLVNAPYEAAENVFQAAIREEVDFVVLAGDLLDPTHAGPRAVAFLRKQFEKLGERGISIYWAASEIDSREDCIRMIEWPANVRIFESDKVEQLTHFRGEHAIADLLGRSWTSQRSLRAGEYLSLSVGGYQIAVLHERADLFNEPRQGIEYWAVGGSKVPDTPFSGIVTAHCPGSPQGFCPAETGNHGCTLVSVGSDGETRLRMIETDAVSWYQEQIDVAGGSARSEAHNELRSRVRTLAEQDQAALVNWQLSGIGRFDSPFAQSKQRTETLNWLRREYGFATPPIWSLSLNLDPPHALRAEWCEEDSIMGDYMRVVSGYQEHDERPIELRSLIGDHQLPARLQSETWLTDPFERDEVLRQAALLGLDLLRGDDRMPHETASSSS